MATEESRAVSGIVVSALHFDRNTKSTGKEIALSHIEGRRIVKGGCDLRSSSSGSRHA